MQMKQSGKKANQMKELKQAIIVRADLQMGKGKIAAQASHASVLAYDDAVRDNADVAEAWMESGCKKIVLKVASEEELLGIFMSAKKEKLPVALIADAGRTQIDPGTKTAVAIGPALESKIDAITSKLKLL